VIAVFVVIIAALVAAYYLSKYASSRHEADYESYLRAIAVPLGDKKARPRLIERAEELRAGISTGQMSQRRIDVLLADIEAVDKELTVLEDDFSFTLGAAARWAKWFLALTMLVAGAVFVAIGVFLGLLISKHLRRELFALSDGAVRVSRGDFEPFFTDQGVEGHRPRAVRGLRDPVRAPAPAPVFTEATGGTETILIVEDETEVRAVEAEMLRDYGYTVLEARNGEEALAIARRHPAAIHLLVTDRVMPQIGGRELVRRLTRERPDMRVLYVSGYTDESIKDYGPWTRRFSRSRSRRRSWPARCARCSAPPPRNADGRNDPHADRGHLHR
jgi:CheY-like chemotaxis protein